MTVSIRIPGHGDIHLASGVDDRAITAYRPDPDMRNGRPVTEDPVKGRRRSYSFHGCVWFKPRLRFIEWVRIDRVS